MCHHPNISQQPQPMADMTWDEITWACGDCGAIWHAFADAMWAQARAQRITIAA